MPLTALIIDDEPLARQELQYLLDRDGDVTVLAQGSNGIEAVELIRTHKPDVVFLDVRMPGLDGFAVLKKLMALDRKARLPQVVFATAFDQYAVKAFEVNAVDYLLKPFDSKRVVKTLEKVRARAAGEGREGIVEPYEAPPAEPSHSRQSPDIKRRSVHRRKEPRRALGIACGTQPRRSSTRCCAWSRSRPPLSAIACRMRHGRRTRQARRAAPARLF